MAHQNKPKEFDVAIIGGLGHVGLPLGLVFANAGLRVCLIDVNARVADKVLQGEMPFVEYGADEILKKTIADGTLTVSLDPSDAAGARHVIIALGTPIDEFMNPQTRVFLEHISGYFPYLSSDQTIIIRSTVYPRTCGQVTAALGEENGPWHLAYCPERIVQGYAVKELGELPQIIAGLTDEAGRRAAELFGRICPEIIHASVQEAELAKLYCNAWRYIQFAVANQFYMIAHDFGTDFSRIRRIMAKGYGRAASLPGAGFAAGPCLLKDTMQLAAFHNSRFFLGHAAMMVNEGLPGFIAEQLLQRFDLRTSKVGILGMAFKADIDDTRNSLSYKLGKILRFHGAKVYYSDECAQDPTFVSKETIINECDIIIVGVPHSAYRDLHIPDDIHVVDLWEVVAQGMSLTSAERRSPVSRIAA